MKEHLKRFHTVAAKHHAKLAKIHSELADEASSTHGDLEDGHPLRKLVGGLARCHKRKAAAHGEFAQAHFRLAKSLGEPAARISELPDIDVEELAERGEGGEEADNLKRVYKILSTD